jgi:hypothetical protein
MILHLSLWAYRVSQTVILISHSAVEAGSLLAVRDHEFVDDGAVQERAGHEHGRRQNAAETKGGSHRRWVHSRVKVASSIASIGKCRAV